MIIKSVTLQKLIVRAEDEPKNGPSFAFIGRSNVGKSSLLNAICYPLKPAFISSKPGKTATLNFYLVNNSFFLVDVPGYGYALRSEKERTKFKEMIYQFLKKAKHLSCVFLLIDFNVGFTRYDLEMKAYLEKIGIKFVVIFTKTDKTPITHQMRQFKKISAGVLNPIVSSSVKRSGIEQIKEIISGAL